MKILLDTNFLLIPGTLKVDIFSEMRRICDFTYELCVLDRTIEELDGIVAKQNSRYRKAAKLALKLLKKYSVRTLASHGGSGDTDSMLVEKARTSGAVVATQDRELKARLKKAGINVIALRQKKYLILC